MLVDHLFMFCLNQPKTRKVLQNVFISKEGEQDVGFLAQPLSYKKWYISIYQINVDLTSYLVSIVPKMAAINVTIIPHLFLKMVTCVTLAQHQSLKIKQTCKNGSGLECLLTISRTIANVCKNVVKKNKDYYAIHIQRIILPHLPPIVIVTVFAEFGKLYIISGVIIHWKWKEPDVWRTIQTYFEFWI